MSDKFIPNGHDEFALMASNFAKNIAADPARFAVLPADAETLSAAVKHYQQTLQDTRNVARSQYGSQLRTDAREPAVKIIRKLGSFIRANDQIDAASKILVGIRSRNTKPKQLACPQEPPRLKFVQALHQSGATPMHELQFRSLDSYSSKKPDGAVRLELFVDLIPPEEPIPAHPGANLSSRPWYLRSYTRSPIVLAPPMTRYPMRVVYWGRWAGSTGDVGPFSVTAAGWIEGGSPMHLPGGPAMGIPGGPQPQKLFEEQPAPTGREQKYTVAIITAQYQSMHQAPLVEPAAQLPPPDESEPRQLEGPPESEAA